MDPFFRYFDNLFPQSSSSNGNETHSIVGKVCYFNDLMKSFLWLILYVKMRINYTDYMETKHDWAGSGLLKEGRVED